MEINSLQSKLLENAIQEFAKLPGIGKRTAMRLVLHLLRQPAEDVMSFGNAILDLRNNIQFCKMCHNISDGDICRICSSKKRDSRVICVVENIRDLLAIENTNQYSGMYHILNGLISPMDGIGPNDLNISTLVSRVTNGDVTEVIFALSTTMEGDTTNYYLFKKLQDHPLKITTIARGVAFGDELEYTDELTLGKSIQNRTLFYSTIVNE
ncbi:MAG: recombination mediator RecR [Bacteroidota bacterium]